MIRLLTKQEYQATFESPMNDVTTNAQPVINIWDYVNLMAQKGIILPDVFNNQLVERVYRNGNATYDHVLLPTINEQRFTVILVNIDQAAIYGYYLLNLDQEYGIVDGSPDAQ